jgi:hypothetical protein
MTDSPDALIDFLDSLDAKPEATEPGVIWKPSIFCPGVKFRGYTRDAAGIAAWERAAQNVAEYQKSIAPPSGSTDAASKPAAERPQPFVRIVRV